MESTPPMGKTRLAVLAAFFINGALTATWVSRIPAVQMKLGLSEGVLGLVLLSSSAGIMTALMITGGLIARYGSQKMTLFGAVLMCIVLPLLALAPNPLMLVAALFFFGCGLSVMDVSMNEQAVLFERKIGRIMISSFHASYSIGGLVGSLVSAAMASQAAISTPLHFILAAVFFGVWMILAYSHLLPSKRDSQNSSVIFHLPDRALWAFGVVAFCAALAEHATGDWSAIYLVQDLNTSAAFAALGYSAFSLAMTIGRLLGDFLSSKHTPAFIIRTGGLTAAIGFLMAVSCRNPIVSLVGFGAVGLGVANIFPMIYRVAGNYPGIQAGVGIAGVATIGYLGFLIGPPMIGFLAEALSLRMALLIIGLLVGSLVLIGKSVKLPATAKNIKG